MKARILSMRGHSHAEPVSTPDQSDSPRDQTLTRCVLEALEALQLPQHQLAALQGVRPEQWTRQREGRDGHRMHVQRLDRLPEEFLDALLVALARARGVALATPHAQMKAIAAATRALAEAMEQMSALGGQQELPFERRREVRHA